jgi:hypothetical protein
MVEEGKRGETGLILFTFLSRGLWLVTARGAFVVIVSNQRRGRERPPRYRY